jgi:hypothetical protein
MGGETHAPDLAYAAPALLRVLEKYSGKVILRIWGGKPAGALLSSPWVDWVEINEHDYARFAAFFGGQKCDLFVAPLEDNLFNRCKSAIKFLEYSVLAAPGVYSDLPAYQMAIQHGVNGFLAAGLEDWELCLEKLIESPELRAELGRKAQQSVKKDWLLSDHAPEWAQVFRQAIDLSAGRKNQWREPVDAFLRIARQAELHQRELESLLEQRNQQLASYDARLAAASGRLQDIQSSRSWQLIQKFQKLRLSLAPPGSWRERLLLRKGR